MTNLRDHCFLLDESVSNEFGAFLKQNHFEIISSGEAFLSGRTDIDVINYAIKENLIIITHDSDFGRLVNLDKFPVLGIIYLRPGHIAASFHFQTFNSILELKESYDLPFIIVAENRGETIKIRIRQTPS